jgi:uncharacterized protein (TIGR03382 family)
MTGLLVGIPAAIACRPAPPLGLWEAPAAGVGDPDEFVPEVVEYALTLQGPDLCESSTCNGIVFLNLTFELGGVEWPLEGSYDDSRAIELGLLPGYQLEFRGDVPCADDIVPRLESPQATTGSLTTNSYEGRLWWSCQPSEVEGWSFDARFAVVDMHGEQGDWSEWRRYEHTNPMSQDQCGDRMQRITDPGRPLDAEGNPIGEPSEPSGPDTPGEGGTDAGSFIGDDAGAFAGGDAAENVDEDTVVTGAETERPIDDETPEPTEGDDTGISGPEPGIVINEDSVTPTEDEEGCSATGSAPTHALPWFVAVVGLLWRRRRRS